MLSIIFIMYSVFNAHVFILDKHDVGIMFPLCKPSDNNFIVRLYSSYFFMKYKNFKCFVMSISSIHVGNCMNVSAINDLHYECLGGCNLKEFSNITSGVNP